MKIGKIKKGLTLIEALFVLGIMAIIIGMVMVYYSQSSDRTMANKSMQEIGVIKDAMSSLMTTPQAFDNFNTQILTRSGLIPSQYIASDYNSLVTPWKTSATVVGNGGMTYAIYFFNMSPKQCIELLTAMDPRNFQFVQVASIMFGVGESYYTPATASNIAGTCHYNQSNTVIFAVDQNHF